MGAGDMILFHDGSNTDVNSLQSKPKPKPSTQSPTRTRARTLALKTEAKWISGELVHHRSIDSDKDETDWKGERERRRGRGRGRERGRNLRPLRRAHQGNGRARALPQNQQLLGIQVSECSHAENISVARARNNAPLKSNTDHAATLSWR